MANASPTLIQALMRGINQGTGAEAIQNVVGAGKHLWSYGLPDSVGVEGGRAVLRDKDVTNPETVGSLISLPKGATPTDVAHEQRHAAQGDILGPGMILARPAEATTEYGSGPLERDAYRATEPTTEFLRKKPSGYAALLESLFASTLGK